MAVRACGRCLNKIDKVHRKKRPRTHHEESSKRDEDQVDKATRVAC